LFHPHLCELQRPSQKSCGDSGRYNCHCNMTYMAVFGTAVAAGRGKFGRAKPEPQTSSTTCQFQHDCSCHLPNTIFYCSYTNAYKKRLKMWCACLFPSFHWYSLPRCMECRRGLAMRILSVCLSHTWIVTKWLKDLSRFIYHTIDHLA